MYWADEVRISEVEVEEVAKGTLQRVKRDEKHEVRPHGCSGGSGV